MSTMLYRYTLVVYCFYFVVLMFIAITIYNAYTNRTPKFEPPRKEVIPPMPDFTALKQAIADLEASESTFESAAATNTQAQANLTSTQQTAAASVTNAQQAAQQAVAQAQASADQASTGLTTAQADVVSKLQALGQAEQDYLNSLTAPPPTQ